MKKNEDDLLGGLLDELVHDESLRDLIPTALERAATAYDNIMKRARETDDAPTPSTEELAEVRKTVLREALLYTILRKLNHFVGLQGAHGQWSADACPPFQRVRQQRGDAREGGLLATPGTVRKDSMSPP